MNTINLLPPTIAARRTARIRGAFWSKACTLTAAASALVISVSMSMTPNTDAAERRLAQLRSERTRIAQVAVEQAATLAGQSSEVNLLDRVGHQPDWSVLLTNIAGWCDGKIMLDEVSLHILTDGSSFGIRLTGVSKTQEDVGELVKDLRNSDWFGDVSLAGTSRAERSAVPAYRFEINCKVRGLASQAEALHP